MASRSILLALANLLIPVAILVFATGFFPYKPFMPGLARYEELSLSGASREGWKKPPEAPFDKLVFMVVDALRSDFVFEEGSGMNFVQRYRHQTVTRSFQSADYCPVLYETVPHFPSQLMRPPPPSQCLASKPSPQAPSPPL
jgi:hypothetical protein